MELVVVIFFFFLFQKCNHFWRSLTICLRLSLQADCVFCLFKPADFSFFFFFFLKRGGCCISGAACWTDTSGTILVLMKNSINDTYCVTF